MFAQNQYQIDAERRRDIQRTAERERQANQRQQKSTQNMFTTVMRWMSNQTNQSDIRPADQTQVNQQVAMRSI